MFTTHTALALYVASRCSPATILTLEPNEVFVFGSNEAGIHGKGAALFAKNHFGYIQGHKAGLLGSAYGIPTKDANMKPLPIHWSKGEPRINSIQGYVGQFLRSAHTHPSRKFLVTEVGCGLAKYSPEEIAPLFRDAFWLKNVHLPRSFWEVLVANL